MTQTRAPKTAPRRHTRERIRDAESVEVTVPGIGKMRVPRPEQLAFYAGLAALAAFEIVDWPVAALIGLGHLLSHNQHNRIAQEIGEALEEA